jgi:hypothetical protein
MRSRARAIVLFTLLIVVVAATACTSGSRSARVTPIPTKTLRPTFTHTPARPAAGGGPPPPPPRPGKNFATEIANMKTYRHLYPQVWPFENLYIAYRAARRWSSWKAKCCRV